MKALVSISMSALLLLGCNATMRQTAGPDPSLTCYQQLDSDPRFAALRGKTDHADRLTLEMLSDHSRATEEQKLAIRVRVVAGQTCLDMGRDFRAQNGAPAYFTDELDRQQREETVRAAKLYSGEMTFADYNRAKQSAYEGIKTRLAAGRDRAQAAQQTQAANAALIMQMARPIQVAPMPFPRPSQVCRSRRVGTQIETVCD